MKYLKRKQSSKIKIKDKNENKDEINNNFQKIVIKIEQAKIAKIIKISDFS